MHDYKSTIKPVLVSGYWRQSKAGKRHFVRSHRRGKPIRQGMPKERETLLLRLRKYNHSLLKQYLCGEPHEEAITSKFYGFYLTITTRGTEMPIEWEMMGKP